MKAFIRHILRSADSEKGQVAVIVITIALVTCMLFIALGMYDVFFNLNMAEYDRVAQGADMLLGDNFGGGEVFSRARVQRVLSAEPEGEIKDVTYFTKISTILKTKTESKAVLVEATDLEEYLGKNPIKYVDIFDASTQNPDLPYNEAGGYSSIIISEGFAEETGIKVGEIVQVYLPTYNMYTDLVVRAIALNEGIFGSGTDLNVLVDFDAIGNQGQVNAVYINFIDDAYFEKYENIFKTYFPTVECGEGNSYSEVVSIVTNNTLLFSIALVFLVATLGLILFTSYLIISRNRMSEMIVFKSAGATPNQVAFIMIMEVVFYAVVGGAIGLMLGRVMMGVVTSALLPHAPYAVTYPFWKFLVAFVVAIAVSILSTLVPVLQVSKKTVRELSSSGFKGAKESNFIAFIVSSVLVVGIAVAYAFLSGIALLVLSVALIIAIAFWIYASIGYVTDYVGKLLQKIVGGGPMFLAGLSVKRSSAMRTVTTLIAVVITFSFLITQLVGIVKDATIPFRSRYDADYVVLSESQLGEADFDLIKGTALGVQGIAGVGWFNSIDYNPIGDEDTDITIYGVGDHWALEHCTVGLDSGVKERWQNAEKPIVLNQNVAMLLGVEIGDKVSFVPEKEDFKTETHEFTVVGIDKSVSQWDMVAYCDYKVNYRMNQKATFLVSASQVDEETFVDLRDAIENLNLSLTFALTFDEWAYAEQENFAGVGTLMTLLQILVWVISIMGVGNIAIVTVYDRKSEFRLYKLSGMSSSDYMKFAFGEGIVTAISGGLLGFIAGYAVNMLVPSLGSIIQRYSSFNIMPWQLLATFAIGVTAFMILWTLIALVNRNIKTGPINERNLNR